MLEMGGGWDWDVLYKGKMEDEEEKEEGEEGEESQSEETVPSRSHHAENAQGLGWEQTVVYSH